MLVDYATCRNNGDCESINKYLQINLSYQKNSPKQGLYEYSHSDVIFRDDAQYVTCMCDLGNISTGKKKCHKCS